MIRFIVEEIWEWIVLIGILIFVIVIMFFKWFMLLCVEFVWIVVIELL